MRIAAIYDIHSNLFALEAVLDSWLAPARTHWLRDW